MRWVCELNRSDVWGALISLNSLDNEGISCNGERSFITKFDDSCRGFIKGSIESESIVFFMNSLVREDAYFITLFFEVELPFEELSMRLANYLEDLRESFSLCLRVHEVYVIDNNLDSNNLLITNQDSGCLRVACACNTFPYDRQDSFWCSLEAFPNRIVLGECFVDKTSNFLYVFLSHHFGCVVLSYLFFKFRHYSILLFFVVFFFISEYMLSFYNFLWQSVFESWINTLSQSN